MIVLGKSPATAAVVTAADEDACLTFGPPRSGKSTGVVIPSVLAHRGPVIVTSSKPDVLLATAAVRAQDGPIHLFTGTAACALPSTLYLAPATWSPIPTCDTWEAALLHARAMTGASGPSRTEDQYWRNHAERVIAALMLAANVTHATMGYVAGWVLTGNLDQATTALRAAGHGWAMAVVEALDRSHDRHRDSVLATASDVLRVYDHTTARQQAARPSFDIDTFLANNATLYIVAPADEQDLLAPVVVGLISDIVRRAIRTVQRRTTTVLLALDELARIAPLPQLPGWLAEAGSHRVQILGILQDLSQARHRWGNQVADGFLTLFRHKVLLPGVMDHDTLQHLSALLGDDVWSPAAGTLTPRPRWPIHQLTTPPAGKAIHINLSTASHIDLFTHHDLT